MKKIVVYLVLSVLIIAGVVLAYRYNEENGLLKRILTKLDAEGRAAQALVTDVTLDDKTGQELTTLKFLEYDTKGFPLKASYFTFPGNILQFQSVTMRFDDSLVVRGRSLSGKAAYIFRKVVASGGSSPMEFEVNKAHQVPAAYRVEKASHPFEEAFWRTLWGSKKFQVESVQVEASGSMFVPGTLYTIKIGKDGRLSVDTQALSAILSGERIPDFTPGRR